MHGSWALVGAAFLVGAGVAAEVHLLRALVKEFREGCRERVGGRRTPRRESAGRRGVIALVLSGVLPASAYGADPTPGTPPAAAAATPSTSEASSPAPSGADAASGGAVPQGEKSAFSLQINLDYTTAYFYHGIVQEDSGLILQPSARLTVGLFEKDDFKVDGLVGTWNSFHGQKTGASTRSDFTEYWYESDLYAGVVLTKGPVSLTTTYTFLTSPSDAYETVQELGISLGFDDTGLFGAWALHPYATFAIEMGADASDGADSDTGTYLELGIAPGFSVDLGKTPVAISFPVAVGLSLSDYYQDAAGKDDTFGFFQIGAKAAVPLPIGDRFGKWTLNAGVAGLFLGDQTREYNGGDRTEVIGTVGLQVNF